MTRGPFTATPRKGINQRAWNTSTPAILVLTLQKRTNRSATGAAVCRVQTEKAGNGKTPIMSCCTSEQGPYTTLAVKACRARVAFRHLRAAISRSLNFRAVGCCSKLADVASAAAAAGPLKSFVGTVVSCWTGRRGCGLLGAILSIRAGCRNYRTCPFRAVVPYMQRAHT